MKRIVIYQKHDNFPLEFFDDDNNNLEDFCKQLENSFLSQTVVTLHFDKRSVVFRPSLLSKIYVEEVSELDDPFKLMQKQMMAVEKTPPVKKNKPPVEPTEDMITEE